MKNLPGHGKQDVHSALRTIDSAGPVGTLIPCAMKRRPSSIFCEKFSLEATGVPILQQNPGRRNPPLHAGAYLLLA